MYPPSVVINNLETGNLLRLNEWGICLPWARSLALALSKTPSWLTQGQVSLFLDLRPLSLLHPMNGSVRHCGGASSVPFLPFLELGGVAATHGFPNT